jgi:hypothetical protein
MWRRFPARGLAGRLLLFVVFLAAMAALRGCLGERWRAGEQRARALVGAGPVEPPGPEAGQAEP